VVKRGAKPKPPRDGTLVGVLAVSGSVGLVEEGRRNGKGVRLGGGEKEGGGKTVASYLWEKHNWTATEDFRQKKKPEKRRMANPFEEGGGKGRQGKRGGSRRETNEGDIAGVLGSSKKSGSRPPPAPPDAV